MWVSAKYLAVLATLLLSVSARTTENTSAEQPAAVDSTLENTDNALINALEEEEKVVLDRIDALEDSIKTLTTMDVDKELDESINKTKETNVKPVNADKPKSKKSKG